MSLIIIPVQADKVVADSVVDIDCAPTGLVVQVAFVLYSIAVDLVAVDIVHGYTVLVDRQHYFANHLKFCLMLYK